MTLRRKGQLLALTGLVGMFLLAWLFWTYDWPIAPFTVFLVAYGIAAFLLRCPKCDKPIMWNPLFGKNSSVYGWSLDIPRRCTRCGTSLE